MSGGVDSSVSAALLVEQGFEVVGGFMKNWSSEKDAYGVCEWKKDFQDAKRVVAKLGIALHLFDFEKQYEREVYQYMVKEYRAGRTPNPDVLCNQKMKFGYFLKAADKLGCDYVATGHYAGVRIVGAKSAGKSGKLGCKAGLGGKAELLQAVDKNKDQTYFLHRLNQLQLKRAIFPLQKYTKPEVRKLAKKFDLPTKNKKESMGVCFVGKVSMKDFLKKEIKPKKGEVVNEKGEVIGKHEGLAFYTIGQRHGFGGQSSGSGQKSKNNKPVFVADKNFKKNQLIVAPKNSKLHFKIQVKLKNVHWIGKKFEKNIFVRLRHRGDLVGCEVKNNLVKFKKPQFGVAPGQFCVFYSKTKCLGGGVVK